MNGEQIFCANKLSLNTDKTKYVFFHKAKSKHNLPQILPYLFINDAKIERENSLKFLGTLMEHSCRVGWKQNFK